jgi:hypothetical protein
MMIRNATEGISYPLMSYQQAMLDKLNNGGFKPGQMTLYSSGRQTGKSMYMNLLKTRYYGTNLCKEIVFPMKPEPKYKFSRAKWYVAELDWGQQTEVLEWCTQQFGPHSENPDAWSRWCHRAWTEIHFRDAKDYEWFLLRWGK